MSFKIKNQRSWKTTINRMKEDIAEDMIKRIQWELVNVKGYYDNIGDSFTYDSTEGHVHSFLWSAAIVNQGRMPGTYAPHTNLVQWVLEHKEPGASIQKANQIAYKVNRKLFNEGIEPNWYMDEVLIAMEDESER